jgi:hypothetical protein
MYGCASSKQFSNSIKVFGKNDLLDLVKEAQAVTGKPFRKFLVNGHNIQLGYNGCMLEKHNVEGIQPLSEEEIEDMVGEGLFTFTV